MFPVVLRGMYIFITSPHISFLFSFRFWQFLFLFQFQILISRIARQVDMADQIPSGTGQRENSDQIPDVSATQKNLWSSNHGVCRIHSQYFSTKTGKLLDCQLQSKEKKTCPGSVFFATKTELKRFTSLNQANFPVKKFRIDIKSNAEVFWWAMM